MGENSNTAVEKKKGLFGGIKNFFDGLKTEFSKIIWPDKETLKKESAAAVFYTALLACIIALLDFVFQLGLDKLISLK